MLIDTHTLIWALCEPEKLCSDAQKLITNLNNKVFISIASLWELQIKKSLNKVTLPNDFIIQLKKHGYAILSINHEHILVLDTMPMFHRDPFDRILIAQSIYENVPLITNDSEIAKYDVQIINA